MAVVNASFYQNELTVLAQMRKELRQMEDTVAQLVLEAHKIKEKHDPNS